MCAESTAAKLAASKPPKPRKADAPRHVVEAAVVPADNFELPEAISKAKKVGIHTVTLFCYT